MVEREYLDESLAQLRKLKAQAEKAIAQHIAKHFAGPQWQTLSMPKKRR